MTVQVVRRARDRSNGAKSSQKGKKSRLRKVSNLGPALRAAITGALGGEWTPPKAHTAKIHKFKPIFGGLSAIHRHPNQGYGWHPLAVV